MEENHVFPLPAASFDGESREVDPGACFDWLRQGWVMFIEHPAIWLGCSTIMLLSLLLTMLVMTPVFVILVGAMYGALLGQAVMSVLLPIFAAGLLSVCKVQSSGEGSPTIPLVLSGFRERLVPLLIVGILFSIATFGLASIAFMIVSGDLLGDVVTGRVGGVAIAIGTVMLASVLVFLLSLPVIMATWFAPALIYLNGMSPLAAMRASFGAGAKNWLTVGVFGSLLMIALFALLPMLLGMVIFLPIFSGAVYASYRDIFVGT